MFDTRGKLVKQIQRTPFGRTMHDSSPGVEVPLDWRGGLLCAHTRLVHFGDRVYDPVLGQWMTPAWEELGGSMESPFQLFLYRFLNNNPVNDQQQLVRFQGRYSYMIFVLFKNIFALKNISPYHNCVI